MIWQIETGEEIFEFGGYDQKPSIEYSPSGHWGMIKSQGTLGLIDLFHLTEVKKFLGIEISISLDEKQIYTIENDGTVCVWEI